MMTADGMLNIVAAGLVISCLSTNTRDMNAGIVVILFGLFCAALLMFEAHLQ